MSAEEIVRFLDAVSSLKSRVALTTAYAAGLWVSEVAALKVVDIESDRTRIEDNWRWNSKPRRPTPFPAPRNTKGLIETLADLPLEAFGEQTTTGDQAKEGGGDEPQSHR